MGKRSNGAGSLLDTMHYRFQGLELADGTLSVDGVDPKDVEIQLDDEIPADPQPKPGKVVDKIVPVELRLHKTFDTEESGPNRTVKSMSFRLSCENPEFTIRGTDIEVMRKAVWDFLDQQFAVKWTPYLLVRVEPASLYSGGTGNGLGFSYERIERGVAHDGSLLMRRWSRGYRGGYEVSAWPGEFKDKLGKLMACIQETEENEKAMKEMIRMIDQLRERLAAHFRPDTILQTLANLGGLQMLGSAPQEADA